MSRIRQWIEKIWKRRILRRSIKTLAMVFTAVHVYGLVLISLPPPTTITMIQRGITNDIQRTWTPIEEISPFLVYAVIGAEDSRFCAHHGIDWQAVEKVLEEREAGQSRRGGSTITQQTAKNVYLWNGGGWMRKLPESWFALYIDAVWRKKRIMEVYLNVAEWGDGIFGAEAAAQARFGKSAKTLTLQEASLMAAVLPNPHKWRLDPPGEYVASRANTLAARAADVKIGGYGECAVPDGIIAAFPAPDTSQSPVQENSETGAPDE